MSASRLRSFLDRARGPFAAAALATLLCGGLFALEGREDLNLADEGFVWYGVIRTAAGDVPLRDFQSYEPGRYYWGAAWSLPLGAGIRALRLSTALFGAVGLLCGLLVARRVSDRGWFVLGWGLVLAAWMAPPHKLFEPGLAMMAVYLAVRLLEDPSRRNHLAAGAFVGLAAWFGRNHALYAGLGFASLLLWRRARLGARLPAPAALFGAGVALGAAPLISMLLFVPGFAESFFESVAFFAQRGSNLPHPVPWPWRGESIASDWVQGLSGLSVGLGFVLLIAVYAAGLLAAWRTGPAELERRTVLIAATGIGIFYAHHASVRSDASHLAQCIHPMLLALLALPRAFGAHAVAAPALATWALVWSVFALPATHPALARRWPGVSAPALTAYRAAGDELQLSVAKARELRGIEAVVRARVRPDEGLFLAPARPALYPLLGRTSPVWDLYFLWPADRARQQRIIERLDAKAVGWALIERGAPYGREELRFENSHPLVWQYLEREFEPLAEPRLPAGHVLFRRRTARADERT